MGNRLSKIYTRTGDDGSTGLGDGSRVGKDSLRVNAYGTVDELNSTIGMLLAADGVGDDVREALVQVQHDLFDLGGELCIPGMAMVEDSDIARLETILDQLNEPLPPLKEFILPGGGMAAACGHLARTTCRRAPDRPTHAAAVYPPRLPAARARPGAPRTSSTPARRTGCTGPGPVQRHRSHRGAASHARTVAAGTRCPPRRTHPGLHSGRGRKLPAGRRHGDVSRLGRGRPARG